MGAPTHTTLAFALLCLALAQAYHSLERVAVECVASARRLPHTCARGCAGWLIDM